MRPWGLGGATALLITALVWAVEARALDPSGAVVTVDGVGVVVRGTQTRPLAVGDKLFVGDRIITRSGAQLKFTILGCEKSLGPMQSVLIDDDICKKAIVALGPEAGIVETAFVPVVAPAAATPALLLPLLAGGGATAAAVAALATTTASPVTPQ